jgi:gliding motility-associated-like protein
MKRIIAFLTFTYFSAHLCLAQFSPISSTGNGPYAMNPEVSGTGLDKVFIYNGTAGEELSYITTDPSSCTWYKYQYNAADAVPVSASNIRTTTDATILSNPETGYGYAVELAGGLRHYAYLVAYTPTLYNGITTVSEGDPCTNLTLSVSAAVSDLIYYATNGSSKKITRQHTLTWNSLEWNATSGNYGTKAQTSTSSNIAYHWEVTAPLCNTTFTVTGDQIATYFGTTASYESAIYQAIAVETNATAAVEERTADNELDKSSGELSGSAPLNITFKSNPSDAVQFSEWYIYDTEDASGSYKRYTDEELLHSFTESGKFLVKLYVSNGSCKDSASFEPNITVSQLECPNFFSPRSTPGDNDEFRVAYKSIVSFKGIIINRWGNTIFEWTDPSKGWNGTFKGKAVSPGVYFYLIEAKGADGIVYKKKGDINLLE